MPRMPQKKEDWLTTVTASASSFFQTDETATSSSSNNTSMAGGDKRNEGSSQSSVELLALVRKDVTGMSDDDLDRLVLETKLESSRRRKIPTPSRETFKRYGGALALLVVVLVLVFKGETSAMDGSSSSDAAAANSGGDEIMAKEGEKGAWIAGDADLEAHKKDKEDDQKMAQGLTTDEATTDETTEAAAAAATEEETAAAAPEITDPPTNVAETTDPPANVAETTDPPAAPVGSVAELPTKADDAAKLEALKTGRRPRIKYQYQPRSKSKDDSALKTELAAKWGSWTFVDTKDRPKDDFPGGFPNRDIPWDQFPANAWQTDQDYLAQFLPEAKAHVERAMEAILAEYGMSKWDKDIPEAGNLTARLEASPFQTRTIDFEAGESWEKTYDTLGGWMSQSYVDGLVRRLMHALITQDTFTLVMGGHSASAGHGNHFQQSYTLQFQKVMEPVMARLGIKLMSHNLGYGGLGTVHNSLAAGDIYGKEIDIYVWDSSMTEKSNEAYDLYVRQVFLTGNRIPVLLGGMHTTLASLHKNIDAEIGFFGTGVSAFPETSSAVEADKTIWAARCLNHNAEIHDYCRSIEYNGTCWIDRDDYTPEKNQNAEPGGRAGWHPGFRFHALRGRIQAMMVLRAFYKGLEMWEAAPDKKLPEEVWHVKDHYDNIRKKLSEVKEEDAACFNFKELNPKRICATPMQGVSEMTPRNNPKENAIINLMKPAADGYLPIKQESVYNPPDVYNPALEPPDGAFDYLAVIENGIDYSEFVTYDNAPVTAGSQKTNNKLMPIGVAGVEPGLGWSHNGNINPDDCDGSYDSFCGRGKDNPCLLYAHNDNRGGLYFDSFSGWGIFTVPNVKKGLIFTRIEWWYANVNTRTDGWLTENNATVPNARHLSDESRTEPSGRGNSTATYDDDYLWIDDLSNSVRNRRLGEPESSEGHNMERNLKGQPICDDAIFEIAFNGKIRRFTKAEYEEYNQVFQRVVPIITIVDDEGLTNGEPYDIEFGIRLTGCAKTNTFQLSNIYWA